LNLKFQPQQESQLSARAKSDGAASRPLGSLPPFVCHDPGAKQGDNQYRPMTTETGRNIVETRVKESLGVEAAGTITPHEVGHRLFGTE